MADEYATAKRREEQQQGGDSKRGSESPTSHEEDEDRGRRGSSDAWASTAHAVRLTQRWKPTYTRRQSWEPEDKKRDLHMGDMEGGLPENYCQLSERREKGRARGGKGVAVGENGEGGKGKYK